MVRFLKKRGKQSIQDGLNAYGTEFLKLNVAVWLLLFFLFFFVVLQHKQDVDYILTLNEFYSQLDELNGELYEDITGAEQESSEIMDKRLQRMRRNLKILKQLKAADNFRRNVDDLNDMFDMYAQNVRHIYECLSKDETENVFSIYGETQEIFNYLNKDFQRIYTQLLNYVEETENRQYIQKLFILGVSVVFFFMLTKNRMKKGKGLVEKIADPVMELAGIAQKVEEGELLRDNLKKNTMECDFREISILQHVFISMLEKLEKQMREIMEMADLKDQMKEKELENLRISNELKNSELKALQMQINPHFLFNTLNMIAKTAYIENAESTQLLLECTASLLRYTLDNSMYLVPLEKEIKMLKNYVSIQENRFDDRIQFLFKLDPSLNQIQVPRLILQPILENAVIHGVGMKISDGLIEIRTYRRKNQCEVCISDNGQGMDREELGQVIKRMKEKNNDGKRIGLSNVYMRLRALFGNEADLQIESTLGEGTTVSVLLPLEKDGELYV